MWNGTQVHCLIDRETPVQNTSHLNNIVVIQIRTENYFPNHIHLRWVLTKLKRNVIELAHWKHIIWSSNSFVTHGKFHSSFNIPNRNGGQPWWNTLLVKILFKKRLTTPSFRLGSLLFLYTHIQRNFHIDSFIVQCIEAIKCWQISKVTIAVPKQLQVD